MFLKLIVLGVSFLLLLGNNFVLWQAKHRVKQNRYLFLWVAAISGMTEMLEVLAQMVIAMHNPEKYAKSFKDPQEGQNWLASIKHRADFIAANGGMLHSDDAPGNKENTEEARRILRGLPPKKPNMAAFDAEGRVSPEVIREMEAELMAQFGLQSLPFGMEELANHDYARLIRTELMGDDEMPPSDKAHDHLDDLQNATGRDGDGGFVPEKMAMPLPDENEDDPLLFPQDDDDEPEQPDPVPA